MSFVHLHTHSQYSLLESSCRVEDLIDICVCSKMPGMALTDNGNMFGAIEFYLQSKAKEVNPIIGMDTILAPFGRHVKGEDVELRKVNNTRLVFLAMNYKGYQELCRISTIGYREGFYYKPRVDYEVLKENSENLICLTGGINGEIVQTFLNHGKDKALEKLHQLKNIFSDRLYLEMNRTGVPEWKEVNDFLQEISHTEKIPLVAGNDVYYTRAEDQIVQEVLVCIGSNKLLSADNRFRLGSDQFYFKTPKEMRELFKDHPKACDATLEINERCRVDFRLKDNRGNPIYYLPSFPAQRGRTLKEEIAQRAKEGLEKRFLEAQSRNEVIADKKVYFDRLEHELSVIHSMGFDGYFLIVQDFIGWAKNEGIPVGPGRGSGAGSLVAYSLRITDLDPLPYNLIFERFLNPERVSMPDFDIDFCQDSRHRVIDYVTEKYGENSVSQIITYGKLQARAAIRDVGRVLGMAYSAVDTVSKLVPDRLGITLKAALEEEPKFKELMASDPQVSTLIDLASKVEGLVRHAGIHAAGVLITDGCIGDHAPLYRGSDGENVVQYDMKHAEKIGLMKFDFLGLKTLTYIDHALKLIKRNRGMEITTKDISVHDPGIYELFCAGDTAGIFQFEGGGITDTTVKAQPEGFEDIIAINALYRPGPMDMIPSYIARKRGEESFTYAFPVLEEITKETFGVIVYQEQVQLIAARISNYSLGEADILRRAMGKKIPEEMAQQKDRFLSGAKENNYDIKEAEILFDSMAEFAKYGFNKSHAAAYCVIAAQTGYLKRYYPVEFFAALLSVEMNDTDRVVKYIKDARSHDIEVMPPHINYSEYKFTVKGEKIFFSLGAIKGVGSSAVEAIVEARENTPHKTFPTLEAFFEAVDLQRMNKKAVECLIKAGALDGFGYNRAELVDGFALFINRAEKTKAELQSGQINLFSLSRDVVALDKIVLPKIEDWRRNMRLAFEKSVLGFFLKDHPLHGLVTYTPYLGSCDIMSLKGKPHASTHKILCMVSTYKEIITKRGSRMAFAQVEDLNSSIEVIVFPKVFASFEEELKSEQPLLISGKLEQKEGGLEKLFAESIEVAETLLQRAKNLELHIEEYTDLSVLEVVKSLLQQTPGSSAITFHYYLKSLKKKVGIRVLEPQGVQVKLEVLEDLQKCIGKENKVLLSHF